MIQYTLRFDQKRGIKISEDNPEGSGTLKKILIILLIVFLVLFTAFVIFIFIYGNTGKVDEGILEIGIDVINVPFSGDGVETIPIQWIVHGGEGSSGVYYASQPSPAVFSTAITPAQAGYTDYTTGTEIELPNGIKVLQADVPNTYPLHYIRVYVQLENNHYWSEEFIIES